jgi:ABC-2 type transport system ATP-binding protein
MTGSQPIVRAEGLAKSYGETKALKNLNLSVEQGTILAVLGPNGAGKTTAVRILTTLLKPDAGVAIVDGFDVVKHPGEVRRRIGLTGQYAALDEILTGRENLDMIGRLYGLSAKDARKRSMELLERFDLVEAGGRLVRTYSGGMRRRLDLASSLIVSPPVLFLDEPTTGLDPRSRINMWDLIEELVASGTTLLLTTQYLEEADRLADDIAVIDHGEVIARGTATELKSRVGGERLEVQLSPGGNFAVASRVLESFGRGGVQIDEAERTLAISTRASTGLITHVVAAMTEQQIQLDNATMTRPTLDDVFLTLTGRPAENDIDTEAVKGGKRKEAA